MKRYIEDESTRILTPDEAQDLLDARDGETLASQASDVLATAKDDGLFADYDERDDPEMMRESTQAFKEGVVKENFRVKLRESREWIKDEMFDYWDENGFNTSEEAYQDFINNYYEPKGTDYNDTIRRDRWEKNSKKYNGPSSDRDDSPRLSREEEKRLAAEKEKAAEEEKLKKLSKGTSSFLGRMNSADIATVTSVEKQVEDKYDLIEIGTSQIITGDNTTKHLFIYGDAGVGKTYSVKKIVEKEWDTSPLKAEGYKYNYIKGSIGSALTAVVAFFFEHREKEILVLDDCDGFLEGKDSAQVNNLLKGWLNSDNVIQNPEPCQVSGSDSTLAVAGHNLVHPETACLLTDTESRFLHGEFDNKPPLTELLENNNSHLIHIDQKRFNEDGYLDISVDGHLASSTKLTEEERKHYQVVDNRKQEEARLLGYGLSKRFTEADEDPFSLEDAAEDIGEGISYNKYMGGGQTSTGSYKLPQNMIFTSRVIFISNLTKEQIDPAVLSRCSKVELTLTHEQFLCHLRNIYKGLMNNLETRIDPQIIEFMKDQAFGFLSSCIEGEGLTVNGKKIEINIPLQFRIIPEIAGLWYSAALAYCRHYGLGSLTMDNIKLVSTAIEANFFFLTLLPLLANKGYTKKK